MNYSFSFLHLSDIHFRHGDAEHQADQPLVLTRLEEDIAGHRDLGIPTPQAILVTGDIAFSGNIRHPDEYPEAKRFLDRLCKQLSIPAQEVYLVPGNHDVQRTGKAEKATMRLLDGLRTGRESLDEALVDDLDQKLLLQRFANYTGFAAGYAPSCASLSWTHSLVTTTGLRVRLCGLPTALLANDDQDQGKLQIGKRQLEAILSPASDPEELIIVLGHHPLEDGWLRDEVEVANWLRSSSNIYACGHIHAAFSASLRYPGQAHQWVRLWAGAVHGERRPDQPPETHSYQFAAIFTDESGRVHLRVWPRRFSDRGKRFVPDREVTEENQDYAEHLLRAPRRAFSSDPTASQSMSPAVSQYRDYVAHQIVIFSDLTSALSSDGRSDTGTLKLFTPQCLHRFVPGIKAPNGANAGDAGRAIRQTRPGRDVPEATDNARDFSLGHVPVRADRALSESPDPWLLLIGPVGTGKSVLLRWIAHSLATNGSEALRLPSGMVPILIELKDFQKSGLATFTDYFNHVNDGLDLCGEPIRRLEREGKILWLLDGLDEIIEEKARRDCVDQIARLIVTGRGRGIMTSRPTGAGYAQQRLPSVSMYSIYDYDLQDMLNFIERWHLVMEEGSSSWLVQRQQLESALNADPRLFDLCRSPLLLALVCYLQRRGPLPSQRRLLYEKALRTLIVSWEQRKGTLQEDLPDPDLVLAFLRELAWEMQKGEQVILLMEEEPLQRFAAAFFEKQGRPTLQADQAAVRLIAALCSSGLLRTVGGNSVGFVHRTFQEYLAAEYFAAELRQGELRRLDLVDLYRRRWTSSTWQETLALLCALLEQDHSQDLVASLRAVAADMSISDGDELLFEQFALRCLAELQHPGREPWRSFCGVLLDVIFCNVTTHFSRIGFPNVERMLLPELRRFGARWPDLARWSAWAFGEEIQKSFYFTRGRAYRCLLATTKREERAMQLRRILAQEGDRDGGEAVEAALREMARLGWGPTEIQPALDSLDQLFPRAALLVMQALLLDADVQGVTERLRKVLLQDKDPGNRLRAAVALVASRHCHSEDIAVLRRLLFESAGLYEAQRLDAVRELKQSGRNPAVHDLLLEIAERAPTLRQAAIVALKNYVVFEPEAATLAGYAEEHPWAVADALGHSQQVPALMGILQRVKSPRARLYSAVWLGRLGQADTAVASLRELAIAADDPEVRADAADALADIDSKSGEAYSQLLELALSDKAGGTIRYKAANILGSRGARDQLRQILSAPDEWVRLHAALGLLGRSLSGTRLVEDDIEDLHQLESRQAFLAEQPQMKDEEPVPEAVVLIASLASNAKDAAVRFVAASAMKTEDERRKAWRRLMATTIELHWRLQAAIELARPAGLDREAYHTLTELSDLPQRIETDARKASAFQRYLRQLFALCRLGQRGRRGMVSMNGIPVGIIEETPEGSRFTYDSLYLLRDDRKSLSPKLALRSEPYESKGLLPLFANLLEEGARLAWRVQELKLDPGDRFGLLLATCGDTIGAIEVLPIPEGTP